MTRQAARRTRRIWLAFAAFFLLAGLVLALAVGHRLGVGVSALFLALVLAAKPFAERYVDVTARWISGAGAERSVGTTLNELRKESWTVLHDIERQGDGNIDHIVSGPGGVFLVETKLTRYKDEHLVKGKRQAARLHDQLGVWVTPVICLHRRQGKPFRARGVWIVPHGELLAWLRSQRNRPAEFARLARFADSVQPGR